MTGLIVWEYDSDDFVARYETAQRGHRLAGSVGMDRTRPGTINALVVGYYGSPNFHNLDAGTRRSYARVIDRFRQAHGDKRVAQLQRRHVLEMMAAKSETPCAANEFLRILRLVMAHAVKSRRAESHMRVLLIEDDPEFANWRDDVDGRLYRNMLAGVEGLAKA